MYKTLVTRGASGRLYVFDIPVDGELDLKKAARAVSEKSVEMLKSKELLPNTGYIHGGCSPIGMKKLYPVIFEAAVMDLSTVTFSAGRVGFQVELNTADLGRALAFSTADLLA